MRKRHDPILIGSHAGSGAMFSSTFNSVRGPVRIAAGRVLSSANEQAIRAARDGLDSVLGQLEQEIASDSTLLQHMNRMALAPGRVRINAEPKVREAELQIYGDIGGGWYNEGITAQSITAAIDALDVDTLNVRINSGGGLVFEGIAIYNAIVRHPANVIVHIDGIAASIASVIAMAGDEIRISEGSHVMIHKPWSFAGGDATALRKEADILDKLESGIIDIYAARTGNKRADLAAMVGAETWLLGQEAVDAGFADAMVPAKTKKAAKPLNSALLSLFKNTPKALMAAPPAGQPSIAATPGVPGAPAPIENINNLRDAEIFLRDSGMSRAASVAFLSRVKGLGQSDSDGGEMQQVLEALQRRGNALAA